MKKFASSITITNINCFNGPPEAGSLELIITFHRIRRNVVGESSEASSERVAKRPRSGDSDVGGGEVLESSPKRRAAAAGGGSQDVLFRIVVPSKQIGRVIGKEGSQIRKIREDTRANIKIADAVARHEERVIIISSKDEDNEISDAENALYHIAKVILKENDESVEPSKIGAVHVAANTIRLLIAGSQAGCLIGKSGQNIEKLRTSSGATIMILAQNQLPLCASACESDRLMQISGDVPEVLNALQLIGCQLRQNPPRQVISIRPTYNSSSNRSSLSNVASMSADYVTMEMTILETLVGGLIGKCGYNISNIRNQSGATIKVSGPMREQDHRQIHFGGSTQQVALARKLVDEYIYSQSL